MAGFAVRSDMNTFEEIAFWVESNEAWLMRFLKLKGSIPSHDMLNRVSRILNPKSFESVFRSWVGGQVPAVSSGTLTVDNKTIRRSGDGENGPIHMSAPSLPNPA